ncbi:MAG: glycerol-3-phosphate dehydrogenase [Propionibacteriaceae bacterium]|jgi:glycerol-3-phosphate dehydrogenase (NAD(P)+)|nr:glycerol-3-phosphate dehydrogenase [Propionibacteriaceae bacterium]
MSTIAVFGAGVMASALTNPVRDNGHQVRLIGTHLDDDIIASVKAGRPHPGLQVRLDPGVEPYFFAQAEAGLAGADVVMVGVNSFGVDWMGGQLSRLLRPGQKVLIVTKGLQADPDGSLKILPQVLRQAVGDLADQVTWSAIVGPCIAGELACRRPSCVVFAGEDQTSLDYLSDLYRTDYYHVWTSTDFIGHEVGAATKNIFAFAQGFAQGLLRTQGLEAGPHLMHNYSAALFAQGSREIHDFIAWLGGDPASADGLAGVGDMYVTSVGGRNVRAGALVGAGVPFSEVRDQRMRGVTLEGVAAITVVGQALRRLTAAGRLPAAAFPLTRFLHRVVTQDAPLEVPWSSFFGGDGLK